MTAPDTAPTSSVKSSIITNLDASPRVITTSGAGATGRYVRRIGVYTPAAAQATSVLARLVRIPSNAVVQSVAVLFDASVTTFTFNCGLWFSSNTNDGTSQGNAGNLTAISSAFFAYQIVGAGFYNAQSGAAGHTTNPTDGTTIQMADTFVDITFANAGGAMTDGQYLPSNSNLPIWQAVYNNLLLQGTNGANAVGAFTSATGVFSVTTDPGGFFDVCIQLHATGSAANQKFTMRVDTFE